MHAALVIMAAGIGSRYGGSKQTDGVGPHGEILMEYGVYDAVRAGFDKVVFIIKPDMRELMERLCGNMASRLHTADGRPVEVCYAYQDDTTLPAWYTKPAGRTKPFGTAHAVLCTRDIVHEPFCVINADDFYGRGAFETVYRFLTENRDEHTYCMVGYRLRNTVTEFGSVARGICSVKDGYLTGVTERTKIFQRGSDAAYTEDDKTFVPLSGDTLVSMNFFGFTPRFLDEIWAQFPHFLDKSLPENPEKCELYLPYIVNNELQAGTARVRMLPCSEVWHGVTYHEDLPSVVSALAALRAQGVYPARLWE